MVAKCKRNMKVDPLNNHTRWKHKIGWQNRGCVWDKIASGRGQENMTGAAKGRRCQDGGGEKIFRDLFDVMCKTPRETQANDW